jgi:hypothetical protein
MAKLIYIDEQQLVKLWPVVSLAALAALFNCSIKAVNAHAAKVGLSSKASMRPPPRGRLRRSRAGEYRRSGEPIRTESTLPVYQSDFLQPITRAQLMAGR